MPAARHEFSGVKRATDKAIDCALSPTFRADNAEQRRTVLGNLFGDKEFLSAVGSQEFVANLLKHVGANHHKLSASNLSSMAAILEKAKAARKA